MRGVLSITLILATFAHGEDQEPSSFERGNTAFHRGQFKEAVANYQAQIESGHVSATLHFNLANASF